MTLSSTEKNMALIANINEMNLFINQFDGTWWDTANSKLFKWNGWFNEMDFSNEKYIVESFNDKDVIHTYEMLEIMIAENKDED